MKNKNSLTSRPCRVRRPWRLATQLAGLLLLVLANATANSAALAATAAPSVAFPPCETAGVCTNDNPGTSLQASGTLGAGATISLTGDVGIPVCDTNTDQGQTWSPSRCYASVSISVETGTCYFIDLKDDMFNSVRCASVLYKDPSVLGGRDARLAPNSGSGDDHLGLVTYDYPSNTPPFTLGGCLATSNFNAFTNGSNGAGPWNTVGPPMLDGCTATHARTRSGDLHG